MEELTKTGIERSNSFSQNSETSQTAQQYIATQLSLEADAREALPYQFDNCTKPLGPLRQSVYACLTCTPPPASPHQQFTPAGVCYSCSISCHGEHDLVELFTKRNFVCDCGTTRLSNGGTPCTLRQNAQTGGKGDVKDEEAHDGNTYNHNFAGKFCGCGDAYDPEKEKGTMFQCLGLGTIHEGGCGEDWWHPECLVGLPRTKPEEQSKPESNGTLETVKEETEEGQHDAVQNGNEATTDDPPLPPGFPAEDDFDHLICYRCVNAFPWIKQYAGTTGFLPPVQPNSLQSLDAKANGESNGGEQKTSSITGMKRGAEDELDVPQENKRARSESVQPQSDPAQNGAENISRSESSARPRHEALPPPANGNTSLFVKPDFRDHLCRCSDCFPRLAKHPQLLEEEESYEPPISESGGSNEGGSIAGGSRNSGSILDRGEAALSSMDRVRALEGVMAYNHLRDKVKAFLQPYAESKQPVSAEDVKAYFAKLRGDMQDVRNAAASEGNGAVQGDGREEQGGY